MKILEKLLSGTTCSPKRWFDKTELYDVVNTFERSLDINNRVCVAIISRHRGWINNVRISSILESLSDLGIDYRIIKRTGNIENQCHKFQIGIGSSRKVVRKAFPREVKLESSC